MASVRFENVTKHFHGGVCAVDDLSLAIRDGEFMVLVGPSGCGKSTALRMLAGLEEIDQGLIMIGDRVVNDVTPRDRDVAMVFQSYALYPQMTVFDNLAFGLRVRRTASPEVEHRVKGVADALGLASLLRRKPRQLSGGQRQRVALGRAIVREPQAFLLDEPLSNLDAKLRVQTRIELQKQHRALQATFIYVTHDQVEAMTMGDRIAVMKDGVLQQVAPPREIYERPVNMYVAGFIGSPAMNFIPVTMINGVAKASGFEIEFPPVTGAETAVLGIRPEALLEHPREDEICLDLKVEAVEVLGSDQFIYGKVNDDSMTARVDPRLSVSPGDRVRLGIDLRRVHLFESSTGRAILDGSSHRLRTVG